MVAISAAGIGAVANRVPTVCPSFAPGEGSVANGTGFGGQIFFADCFVIASHKY